LTSFFRRLCRRETKAQYDGRIARERAVRDERIRKKRERKAQVRADRQKREEHRISCEAERNAKKLADQRFLETIEVARPGNLAPSITAEQHPSEEREAVQPAADLEDERRRAIANQKAERPRRFTKAQLQLIQQQSLDRQREAFLRRQADEDARRNQRRPADHPKPGFTTVEGNFGDHSAPAKRRITPNSVLHDPTVPLQKKFWEHKIHVDVTSNELKVETGREEVIVIGTEENIAAARQLCLKLNLPIDVVGRKRKPK